VNLALEISIQKLFYFDQYLKIKTSLVPKVRVSVLLSMLLFIDKWETVVGVFVSLFL
jgi:hypothetical protein